MTIRLQDVAARAGVSVKTVSNVVHGHPHVSPATRGKVEDALAELEYRPNLSARSLRRGRSEVVALAVPRLDTPYFAELASATVSAAAERGWTVLVDQTDGVADREREVLAGVRGHLIDGLVLSPMALDAADVRSAPHTIPLVLLGERITNAAAHHLAVDNVAAARAATEHLLDSGRRRVAAIGCQAERLSASGVAPLRQEGYRSALQQRGVGVDPRWMPLVQRYGRPEGAAAMRSLLDLDEPPDAVFCFNDVLALGALHELARRGIRVPEDVAVMGFDDIEEGRFSSPTLSTISQDKLRIARTAVELLAERIGSRSAEPARDVTVPFELLARQSTCAVVRRTGSGPAG